MRNASREPPRRITSRRATFAALGSLGVVMCALVAVLTVVLRPTVKSYRGEVGSSESPPISEQSLVTIVDVPVASTLTERQSVAISPPALGTLVLQVLCADGSPLPNATVVLARDEDVVAHGESDTEGIVLFAAFPHALDVFVLTGNALRHRQHLESGAGRYAVSLREGSTLSGIVLVDGRSPGRAVSFWLYSRYTLAKLTPSPAFITRALDGLEMDDGRTSGIGSIVMLSTDIEGRFTLGGLLPGWLGRLEPGDGYALENGLDAVLIDDPSVPLVIRLGLRSAIRGRVVQPGTSVAVPFAEVTYELANPGEQYRSSVDCDEEGRFVVPLHLRTVKHVRIAFVMTGIGRRTLELSDIPSEGIDLGDVSLQAAFDLGFVVRDFQEQPIMGAVARTSDGTNIQSGPTDASGNGVLHGVSPWTNEIWFFGLGYEPLEVPIYNRATNEESSLEVRLARRLLLDIWLRRNDGSPAAKMLVVLSTWEADPIFPDKISRMNLMNGEFGASSAVSTRGGTPSAERPTLIAKYRSDVEGHIVIDGWRPTGHLNVRIEDQVGHAIVERDIDLLWLGQREAIELVVPDKSHALELHVVDEQGAPVAGASVLAVDGQEVLATTRADGLASIAPLFGAAIDVRVEKGTMCTTFLDGVVLDAPVVRREIALRKGYSVRVYTIDDAEHEIAADRIEARWEGKKIGLSSRRKDETGFTVYALPGEVVELVAYIGGRVFRMSHDARQPEARLLLPSSGRVRLELDPALNRQVQYLIQLRAEDDPSVVLRIRVDRSTGESVELPRVFEGSYSAELHEIDANGKQSSSIARESEVIVLANETTTVMLIKGKMR